MRRACLIVLDSLGCGAAPDAAAYGDEGADTLGHIRRETGLRLPVLESLGLDAARMRPRAAGKDSTTGHWEIAGATLAEPFATFTRFPAALVEAIEREAGVRFIGNLSASGTAIIEELGAEHLRSLRPILYTSADSVLQIAAHEEAFGLRRLHALCEVARRHADGWRIGRVIARPFRGAPGGFARTGNRHDHSMRPPPTVLDAIAAAGLPVIGVGKTADLFAGQGITASHPTASNAEGMARTAEAWQGMREGLLFANLVDFDTLYGHRRDVHGYAAALAAFDAWLGTFMPAVTADDLLVVTADHGNDPTFRGTDHTREEVPLVVAHRRRARPLGLRDGFADVAASLADVFGLPPWPGARSFLTPLAA